MAAKISAVALGAAGDDPPNLSSLKTRVHGP